jgi:hypothetical protein
VLVEVVRRTVSPRKNAGAGTFQVSISTTPIVPTGADDVECRLLDEFEAGRVRAPRTRGLTTANLRGSSGL